MAVSIAAPNVPATCSAAGRPSRRERRRLAHRDRVSARLAELDAIRTLLVRAQERVRSGWVQDAWFSYVDRAGVGFRSRASLIPAGSVDYVSGVCLVTAVRTSGRRGQQVDRALDLLWQTLYADHDQVGWVPPPEVRLARVRDLARWNDRCVRRVEDVVGLLAEAVRWADAEMDRLRPVAVTA